MAIKFSHVRLRNLRGGWVNVAVFHGRSATGTPADNQTVLEQWTSLARASGLAIEQSALAFPSRGRNTFYGTRTLVDHLASGAPLPKPTHSLST